MCGLPEYCLDSLSWGCVWFMLLVRMARSSVYVVVVIYFVEMLN